MGSPKNEPVQVSQKDEARNLLFPVFALCERRPDRPEQDCLVRGEIGGNLAVLFFHNKELAELAVEQANDRAGREHCLLVIRDRQRLIEVLTAIPHEVRTVSWNKAPDSAGAFDMQVLDTLLGWLIRHKS